MSKKFGVSLPFTGYVYVEVSAETEKDALNMAYEQANLDTDIAELEYCSHVTNGNVTHAVLNDFNIKELES